MGAFGVDGKGIVKFSILLLAIWFKDSSSNVAISWSLVSVNGCCCAFFFLIRVSLFLGGNSTRWDVSAQMWSLLGLREFQIACITINCFHHFSEVSF